MGKRVSEVGRVRKYFQLAPIVEARLFLKILCADAGLTVSEPRFKKVEPKGTKKTGNTESADAIRKSRLTAADSAKMQGDAKGDA